MNIRFITNALLILGMTLTASAVSAQVETSQAQDLISHKGGFGGPRLSLTPEQKEKLGAIRDQFTLDTATKKAQLKVQMHQLRELMGKPTIDKQAVLSLNDKVSALKADLSKARLQMMLASSDVFTPEQREQIRERMARGGMRHHFGKGRGHGGCGGGGWHKGGCGPAGKNSIGTTPDADKVSILQS